MTSSNGEPCCTCSDAIAWREYWSVEAIAERLVAEIALYRRIAAERDAEACNDARGPRRVGRYADGTPYVDLGTGPPFAELERRRAERGKFPP